MKKNQPKWFQAEAILQNITDNNNDDNSNDNSDKAKLAKNTVDNNENDTITTDNNADKTSKSDLKTAINDENSSEKNAHNIEDPVKSLRNIFLADLYKFKEEGLYEEALACIQSIIEVHGVDSELLLEAAQIYFLQGDYRRSANCLKSFQNVHPKDCRGFLLQAQIFLQTGKKDDALNTVEQLFKQEIKISSEEDYLALDKIIDKLKKIFKADKLSRRFPAIANYQKKRRQVLKNKMAKAQTLSDNANTKITDSTIVTNFQDTIKTTDKNIAKNDNSPQTNANMDENNIAKNDEINPIVTKPTLDNRSENEDTNITDDVIFSAVSNIWDMQEITSEEKHILLNATGEKINEAILKQVLSYKKKIWLYNFLADVFRQNSNISMGIYLLRQALLLDDENDLLLKNLGYLLYKNKEYKSAQVALEDIHIKDFAVEELLISCKNF